MAKNAKRNEFMGVFGGSAINAWQRYLVLRKFLQ
jgi:hypothetical protein